MIAQHKGEIPIVTLLLPFIGGIMLGLRFPNLSSAALWIALAAICLPLLTMGLGYTRFKIYKIQWIGGILIAFVMLLAGCLITVQHNELNNADHFSKKPAQYLAARISCEPKVKGDLVRFTADISQSIDHDITHRANGTILLTIKDEVAKNLFYGEELLIPANFTEIEPPYNPGEFNYKQYLANQNIHYQLFLHAKQYRVISAGSGNPVIAFALQTRQNLVKKLRDNMRDTSAIAVASTLILGYKADLSNDILQAYSKTGTIHILSVSGGHVAIIYILLNWMLKFLNGYRRGRLIKAIVIISLIWAYALLTGFSPAVNRAALMISMVILGKTYSRYINTLNILAFSAFVLLLYDPLMLTDVGFQLSYLAVAGLIVFQPVVYKWLSFKNKAAVYLWNASSVSISAQVITFPLSAFYFHQFPIYFLVSNLLILAPIVVIMYTGLILLILPQVSYISAGLGFILEHTILLMNRMLAIVEHAPYAAINKIWLTTIENLLLYVIIIAAFYWLYNKKKWFFVVSVCAIFLFTVSISLKEIRADRTQSVTFLNLRKHIGIVFKDGADGVVFTDLADTDKTFKYSIQPMLDSNRMTNYQVCKPNATIHLPWLMAENGFMQFSDKRYLILNPDEALQSIPRQLDISYVYTTKNAIINQKRFENQSFIIDGSNSDSYIKKLINIPVNCSILKRNKSITITSN